jgi:hypothetical protein
MVGFISLADNLGFKSMSINLAPDLPNASEGAGDSLHHAHANTAHG